MKKYKSLYEAKDFKLSALEKIESLVLSGGDKKFSNFTKEELNWLSQTIKKNLKLYRGMGLIKSRTDSSKVNDIKNLEIGDSLPPYLYKKFNQLVSYSKKKSIAKQYSEGQVSIIVEAIGDKNSILVDLENLKEIIDFDQDIFDEDDFDYFKTDKEVLIDEAKLKNPPNIIFKKGKF